MKTKLSLTLLILLFPLLNLAQQKQQSSRNSDNNNNVEVQKASYNTNSYDRSSHEVNPVQPLPETIHENKVVEKSYGVSTDIQKSGGLKVNSEKAGKADGSFDFNTASVNNFPAKEKRSARDSINHQDEITKLPDGYKKSRPIICAVRSANPAQEVIEFSPGTDLNGDLGAYGVQIACYDDLVKCKKDRHKYERYFKIIAYILSDVKDPENFFRLILGRFMHKHPAFDLKQRLRKYFPYCIVVKYG